MLENPHAGDDFRGGGGCPALQTLLDGVHKGGDAPHRQIVWAGQRSRPAHQLAQLAVLVVPPNPLDLRRVPK